jgi:hypothetical protein
MKVRCAIPLCLLLLAAAFAQSTQRTPEGKVSTPLIKTVHKKVYRPWNSVGTPDPKSDIMAQTRAGHDVEFESQTFLDFVSDPEGIQTGELRNDVPSYPDRTLLSVTCSATDVLIGTPIDSETNLIEDGTFLYTDYHFNVQSVIKGGTQEGSTIIVTRPGGETTLNGHSVKTNVTGFPLFTPSKKYLLFLHLIPESKTYQAFRTGSFVIPGDSAQPVYPTKGSGSLQISSMRRQDSFLDEVVLATAGNCKGTTPGLLQ